MHVAGSPVIGPESAWRHLKPKSVSRNVLAEIVGGRTLVFQDTTILFWSKLTIVPWNVVEHWNPRRDVGSLTLGSMEQCREQSFVSCEHQIDC